MASGAVEISINGVPCVSRSTSTGAEGWVEAAHDNIVEIPQLTSVAVKVQLKVLPESTPGGTTVDLDDVTVYYCD